MLSNLNWLAIIAATTLNFIITTFWYSSSFFGKYWISEHDANYEKLVNSNTSTIFSFSLICSFIMALSLAIFIKQVPRLSNIFFAGFALGAGFVGMAFFIIGLFERKKTINILIHAAYGVVSLGLMGALFSFWH